MHKFVQRSCVGMFGNERLWSTPLSFKHMFWGISDRFVIVRTSVQKRLSWCNERTSSLNEVASEFFATNVFDSPHWTLNSCFRLFWTVSLTHKFWCKTGWAGAVNAQGRATKSRRNISQRTNLIHPLDSKHMFWGILDRFGTAQSSVQNGPNWCN
jgi:hypothetical protein